MEQVAPKDTQLTRRSKRANAKVPRGGSLQRTGQAMRLQQAKQLEMQRVDELTAERARQVRQCRLGWNRYLMRKSVQ